MVSAVVEQNNKGCTIHSGDIDGGSGDVTEVLVCVTTDRETCCITEELVAKVCIGYLTLAASTTVMVSAVVSRTNRVAPSTVVTLTVAVAMSAVLVCA